MTTVRTSNTYFNLKEIGKKAAQEAEKEIIQTTLQHTHWNRKKAAKLLKVSYKALLYKIQQYQLEVSTTFDDNDNKRGE